MTSPLLLLTLAVAGATPTLERHVLSDGTEVLVGPMPGAQGVSLRYLVHAGADDEPYEFGGLAHLLEHLIFHGTPDLDGALLFERARAGGSYLNAFTGWTTTHYVLDSPRPDPALLGAYVRMITSPALGLARLANEKGVVSAEAELRGEGGFGWLTDQVLYPGVGGHRKIIGSVGTRAGIHAEDLQAFFQRFYTPQNTTIILTGAVESASALALLEDSSRLAPAAPGPALEGEDDVSEPNIPSESRIPAPFSAAILGYLADDLSPQECDALAQVLHLRGTLGLVARRGLAIGLEVACFDQRGHQLLAMLLSSSILDGPQALDEAEGLARALVTGSLTPRERALLAERTRRRVSRLRTEPAAWADAILAEVQRQGPRGERAGLARALLQVNLPSDAAIRRAAARVVTPDHRFLIQLTLPGM